MEVQAQIIDELLTRRDINGNTLIVVKGEMLDKLVYAMGSDADALKQALLYSHEQNSNDSAIINDAINGFRERN